MTILREDTRPTVVDSFEIEKSVSQAVVLDAARKAARARAVGTVRASRMTVPYDGGWMRIMVAVVPDLDVVGYKEFHLSTGNVVRYAVHVFRLSDGAPLGVVDGALTTPLRTAAAAAIATEEFFDDGTPLRIGVVGSGTEAMAGLTAISELLPLADVRVTSRTADNRDKFALQVTERFGVPAAAVTTVAEVAEGRDMVYLATDSGGAVVAAAADLAGVPFIASIGSTLPIQRELAADVLTSADAVVVDTMDVLEESGDAIAAIADGLDTGRVRLLGQSGSDSVSRRGSTVYKSIGSPEQDVVLAHAILVVANGAGFGRRVEPVSTIKQNL